MTLEPQLLQLYNGEDTRLAAMNDGMSVSERKLTVGNGSQQTVAIILGENRKIVEYNNVEVKR